MKLRLICCSMLGVLLFCTLAAALDLDDIAAHRSCSHCGMDRKSYGYSRALIRYTDGSEVGCCSLNCAVLEMKQHPDRQVLALLVADRGTLELVEGRKAYWVMGGKKRGVMTARPKWAFAERDAAEAFLKQYGGTLERWDAVLQAAQDGAN
jgi:copper chaperone NosL